MFIKLTTMIGNTETIVRINPEYIISYVDHVKYEYSTCVCVINNDKIWVKETPDEIDQLINPPFVPRAGAKKPVYTSPRGL